MRLQGKSLNHSLITEMIAQSHQSMHQAYPWLKRFFLRETMFEVYIVNQIEGDWSESVVFQDKIWEIQKLTELLTDPSFM